MNILEEVANRILPFLKFTGEAAEGDRRIPVLDTTMWFGKEIRNGQFFKTSEGYTAPGLDPETGSPTCQVMYAFYKKPMASPFGILKRSAMMEGTKVATASAEFRRRWKNTSPGCSKSDFEKITRGYVDCLYGSGYGQGIFWDPGKGREGNLRQEQVRGKFCTEEKTQEASRAELLVQTKDKR